MRDAQKDQYLIEADGTIRIFRRRSGTLLVNKRTGEEVMQDPQMPYTDVMSLYPWDEWRRVSVWLLDEVEWKED